MDEVYLSATGDLSITFTKNVLWPKLTTTESSNRPLNDKRALNAAQAGYNINDLLLVKVVNGDLDEKLNMELDVELTSYNAR